MKTGKYRLLGIAALAVLLTPQVRSHLGESLPAITVQAAPVTDETIKRVWTASLPGFRTAALSPDGNCIGIIYGATSGAGRGKVAFWRWLRKPSTPLWIRLEAGASQISVSRDGQYVLTWAKMDPTQPSVSVRRGVDGARLLAQPLDGSVWAALISPDGQFAAFSTSAQSLYLFSLANGGLHRWMVTPGLGNSLAFAPDNATLTAATWDASGVSSYTTRGTPLWQFPTSEAEKHQLTGRVFEAQAARVGTAVLGISYTNVRRGDVHLYVWTGMGEGTPAWDYSLGTDAYHPKALLTGDGRYVAVGYLRVITRGEQSVSERRLALLDIQQKRLIWEQGNLLFSPQLVAVSPNGARITASDGQHSLYNLNAQGRVTSSYTLRGGTIRQIVSTPDDRFLLVYTSDGMLSLLQIGSSGS